MCAIFSRSWVPAAFELRGPVFGATLTGNLVANSGVLYFADLVNKRIIDLEDPTYADLVDTTLIRRENLGAKFQNRVFSTRSGSPTFVSRWARMYGSGRPRRTFSWTAAFG